MQLILSALCFWALWKLVIWMSQEDEEDEEETEAEPEDMEADEPELLTREQARIRALERNIRTQKEILGNYYAQLDWMELQQSGTVPGGKEFTKWQDKIVVKANQIRRAEDKLANLKDVKAMAERELAA